MMIISINIVEEIVILIVDAPIITVLWPKFFEGEVENCFIKLGQMNI